MFFLPMKRIRLNRMLKCMVFVALGVAADAVAQDAQTALTVRILGLRSDQGSVRMEVFDTEAGYNERAAALVFTGSVLNGAAEIPFVPPTSGVFAIRVYHDENENGQLDRTPLGVPEEPVGFSNNARSRFGPPTFRDAALPLEQAPPVIEIRMERPLSTDWQVGVGVGGVFRESPYVGGGYQTWFFPNVVYAGRRFAIFGPRASYLITGGDRWKLNAVGQVRFNALDPDESEELEGMDKRDVTWEMGARLSFRGPQKVEFGFSALTDVLGRHGGQEYVADVSRSFRWSSWRVTPAVSATVLSDKLADYYYAVSEDEARLPQRPIYSPRTAWSVTPALRVFFEQWYPWTLTGSIGIEYLSSQIRNSPVVDESATLTGFFGISRQFGPGARRR